MKERQPIPVKIEKIIPKKVDVYINKRKMMRITRSGK
jgi:hypothetical protein